MPPCCCSLSLPDPTTAIVDNIKLLVPELSAAFRTGDERKIVVHQLDNRDRRAVWSTGIPGVPFEVFIRASVYRLRWVVAFDKTSVLVRRHASDHSKLDITSLIERRVPTASSENASPASIASIVDHDHASAVKQESERKPVDLSKIPAERTSLETFIPTLPPLSQASVQYYTPAPAAHYRGPSPSYAIHPSAARSSLPGPTSLPVLTGAPSNKRAAGSHPGESPAKKKQSKWNAEEDAAIIELRGNGMKWEDISKQLPGRSAISCRLRFQNYLERRSEWDDEKKNKLARLYERFKKDMWEKLAKEMQLPWRAAEAMHWQIGETEMATRANVPVFHLAGQSSGSGASVATDSRPSSTSPHSGVLGPPTLPYPGLHSHSLSQMPPSGLLQSIARRNSEASSPSDYGYRHRADSAQSVHQSLPVGRPPSLPPLGNLTGSLPAPQHHLPPVLPSTELGRR